MALTTPGISARSRNLGNRRATRRGALSLSPGARLFLADENRAYSPSSRLFVNALYADPALAFDRAPRGPRATRT